MKRYLFLLCSVALLSCSTIKKYKDLPEVKAWEGDIRKFEQFDKTEKYSRDAVLFAGSSSIRLWTTLEKDMEPYQVIQRGYGGAKLSDFAVYASRIFSPHTCKAIVLFVGNDITGSDADKSPRQVASLFRNVLGTIRKTHPDTPVFWIAVTPTASRWTVWKEIEKANNLIRNICENNRNTYFIRTDFAFLNDNGQPRSEFFIDDKLHLNQMGYGIWTGIIKRELNKVIPLQK